MENISGRPDGQEPITDTAGEITGRPEFDVSTLLAELAIRQELIRTARSEMDVLVAEARRQDITWVEIGDSLHIRPETAYLRFSEKGKQRNREKAARIREQARTGKQADSNGAP